MVDDVPEDIAEEKRLKHDDVREGTTVEKLSKDAVSLIGSVE